MVANIEDGSVFGYIFFPDNGKGNAGDVQASAECPGYDSKWTSVFQIHIEFADNPFHNQKWDTAYEEQNYKNGNTNKTKHKLYPS